MREIRNVPIDDIRPYKNNPRINKRAIPHVANSIMRFGWQWPILVDKDFNIIAGHTRLEAAKQLGHQQVPILVSEGLNEEEVRAFRIADNRSSEYAQWDMDKLKVEFEELENFDAADFDFKFDIDDQFEEESGKTETIDV